MTEPWQNDPIVTPAAPTSSTNAPWQSDPVVQAAPKIPDVSGVQKMAQDNLAGNDNKPVKEDSQKLPPSPMDRISTAAGFPVDKVISGTIQPSDINAANRGQYVKAIDNGSAINSADWHQTILPDIAKTAEGSVVKGAIHMATSNPYSLLSEAIQGTVEPVLAGATRLAGAAYEKAGGQLSPEWAEHLTNPIPEFGKDTGQEAIRTAIAANPDLNYQPQTFAGRATEGTLSSIPFIMGLGEASIPKALTGAIATGVGGTGAQSGAKALGFGEKGQQIASILGSSPGMIYGSAGRPIVEAVAAKLGKEPSAVTAPEINRVIAEGSKDLHPPASDFKTVATATGIPESGLKTVYTDTGVTPEKIFTDSQQNPQIAADVAAGKVPEQYEHLVEQRPVLPTEQADKLHIVRDDTTRSFSVVDSDGDHVRGGFDSHEEAQQHIEDMRFEAAERAAIKNEGGNEPVTEGTPVNQAASAEPIDNTRPEGQTLTNGVENAQQADNERIGTQSSEFPNGGSDKLSGIYGNAGEPESRSAPDEKLASRLSKRTGTESEKAFQSPASVTEARKTGQLNQRPEKAGACYETAGDIAVHNRQNMVIGTLDNGAGKRIYHAVNYVEDGEKTYVYDGTYHAYFTLEAYDHLSKGWAPVKELTPAEVRQYAQNNGVWPNAASMGLPPAYSVKYSGLSTIKPTIIDNGSTAIKNVIPPSEMGKPTSLRTFLSNNGAKFNESNELVSIKKNGERIADEGAEEYAHQIAKEHGYLPSDNPNAPNADLNEFRNILTDKNGGREAWRDADQSRVLKAQEAKTAREALDPSRIEHEAHNVGIDTEKLAGETDKQHATRLLNALRDFYKSQEGSSPINAIRLTAGEAIKAAEKFTGALTGDLFPKLGEAYIKTFAPELVGDKALRADAYMAKFKTSLQEAENAFYSQSAKLKAMWDKKSSEERMQWLYDHETGRWNEEDDPDHARMQALLDSTFDAEKKAIDADPEKGYKENYLPLQFADAEGVKKFFSSNPDMIRKYGADWFTKGRAFDLIQDAVRAGFKLKTDNPESMLVARLLAGHNMIATMDLLHDMESNGIATPARIFSLEKRTVKVQQAIADLQAKYRTELEAIQKQSALTPEGGEAIGKPVSKSMQHVQQRLSNLQDRLDNLAKEKSDNKLNPEQMKALKDGFRVIGPDSKVWNLHQEVGPLWKNAMESKGLWENQGVVGDAYHFYTGAKAMWSQVKLGLSLFHPVHVAMINLASGMAGMADHLIQGGKLSDLALRDTGATMGITSNTFKGQDHPAVVAWKTAPEARTPEQGQIVKTMVEGGFKPTMSARDTIHFKENFDKAISGVGLNNLRLIGTAVSLPGTLMKPFFEHWIPGMKSEIYMRRCQDAVTRDATLANDAGRRGETFRQIAKDTDRTYGEMNNDVQFWNKTVRDSFNAAFISGGWKLAQIYNARGLLQPLKIAYDFAKTGEFSKDDITYNMLHAYTYTGLTLALGGAINAMLGNPIGTAKDTVWDMVKNLVAPQTGEKNPDGTPIRLNQPAFAKEGYNLAHEINTKGLLGGAGSFLYHQTLLPGIIDTLNNRDFTGREVISDPTDLHQWMNAGWQTISPISISQYEKAESKHSEVGKVAGMLGFPTAGAYLNQTPFEQKVLYTYDEQNPPKGDIYSQKLKADFKSATASGDAKSIEETKARMKEEGMTESQIDRTGKPYTKKFVDTAWKDLSVQDQRRIIESASEEEKKHFKLKSQ